MSRTLLTLSLLATAVLAHADWINYHSAAGHFSVDLPDKPNLQNMDTPVQGMTLKTTTYTAQGHGALGLLTATQFPNSFNMSDQKAFASSYIDSFIRSAHATETSRKPFSVHGYSGTEAHFKLNNQVGTVWVFVAGHQGFGLSVIAPSGLDSIRNRVFNSFKLN